MKPDTPLRATFVVFGLFVGGLLAGSAAGSAAAARAHDPYAQLDLFARVLTTIERDYVEPLPTDRLVDAAIRGMVAELDPQSRWIAPHEVQALESGAVEGLGIEVRPADDALEVTRVVPNSPALRQGIAPGDRILQVDGTSVGELSPEALKARLTGSRGEAAILTILRDGWPAPREIRAVRDRFQIPAVAAHGLGDGVVYARLAQFQEGVADELRIEVGRIVEENGALSGLVLDLRDNPGGLLREAVAVADLFLDEGIIVATQRRSSKEPAEVHPATPGGFPPELPVVVLVNGQSASAAEIVAAALQETGRASLVGEPTYGKGTVQQVYRNLLPDGPALKLTVGAYTTPSGQPVAGGEGRAPDHLVPHPRPQPPRDALVAAIQELELDTAKKAELLLLVAALDNPATSPKPLPWHLPPAERLDADPQLRQALELLDSGVHPRERTDPPRP